MSELQEDGRGGEVEPDAAWQGPGSARAAPGGVEPDPQPELPGCVPAAAAGASGGAEGDHGDGAQAGADRLPLDALRRVVRPATGGGVRGGGEATPGKATPSPSGGAGL